MGNFLSSTGITDVHVLQAAVLHDTVEDTHTTIRKLKPYGVSYQADEDGGDCPGVWRGCCSDRRGDFGVAFGFTADGMAQECTDDTSLSGQRRKDEQVRTAPHKSRQAQQVKLAESVFRLQLILELM